MIYVIIGRDWSARNLTPLEAAKEIMETREGTSPYYVPIHSSNDTAGDIMVPDMAVLDVIKQTAHWEKEGKKIIEKEKFLRELVDALKKLKNK